jgi:hypothetical protein
MPFISLDLTPDDIHPNALIWKMHSQGSGPAINLKIWLLDDSNTKERFSMMRGDVHPILDSRDPNHAKLMGRLNTESGVKVEYDSLAGESFRSTFRRVITNSG